MKIVTIVGARPQFIKAAIVSKKLFDHEEVLIHTGQHYDYNMSEVFFSELDIPKPKYNLGISGGKHGEMTGKMLIEIEKVLLQEKPDLVLVYGDTNSTLAGALAAVKLQIPVCHVEAGVRGGTFVNPEEVNRICCDHVSNLLLCCTEVSVKALSKENVMGKVTFVGDPMYDAFLYYSSKIKNHMFDNIYDLWGKQVDIPSEYNYMTCHREENTKDDKTLKEILSAMQELPEKTIYPVHPRNRANAIKICREEHFNNIILTEPVGYLVSIALTKKANHIVTDSGGLQREAFFAKIPCITVLDYAPWPETLEGNCNQLSKANKNEILGKLNQKINWPEEYYPFGKGDASLKIAEAIKYFYLN